MQNTDSFEVRKEFRESTDPHFTYSFTQDDWKRAQESNGPGTANSYLPSVQFNFTTDTARNTKAVTAGDTTTSPTIDNKQQQQSETPAEVRNSPELQAKLDALDETQRKAYDEIVQAIKAGDMKAIEKILRQFKEDPGKFLPIYECLKQAVLEGQMEGVVVGWDKNKSVFRIIIGDKKLAVDVDGK